MNKEERWDYTYAAKSDAFSSSPQWSDELDLLCVGMQDGNTVMDFACNTGRSIESLSLRMPKAQFMGVDINESALEIAASRMTTGMWLKNLEGVSAEVVDYALCMHALPQLQFPREEMGEIWRVLKRGGELRLITNNKFNDWLWIPLNLFSGYRHDSTRFGNYSLNEVKRLMKDSGFVLDKIEHQGNEDHWFFRMFPILKPRVVYFGHKARALK